MKQSAPVAVCLACIVASALFVTYRIDSLTRRVERLEAAVGTEVPTPTLPGPAETRPRDSAAPPDGAQLEVLEVIDGDTLAVSASTGRVKVRVIGIDAPEIPHPDQLGEPFGTEAATRSRELLRGKTVRVEYDPDPMRDQWDHYGRLLAYIQLPDGRDFGQVIVEEGLARVYTRYPFNRQKHYVKLEAAARRAELGLWSENVPARRPGGQPDRSR